MKTPLPFYGILRMLSKSIHTTVDPESQVGEVLLKDKFLNFNPRYP
jgi:hypothetical protein